jgi:hypothetical protein
MSGYVPTCDRCGAGCYDGHEIIYTGRPEPETGYRAQELVCVACLEDETRWDCADQQMDLGAGY